jgi:UDP-N-acetylmuramoylalanine--D-glutamate ligase
VSDSRPRPDLPPGPYLVVGLARSGQAAVRLLARRGETVIGIDRGAPEAAEGLVGENVEILLDGDRS